MVWPRRLSVFAACLTAAVVFATGLLVWWHQTPQNWLLFLAAVVVGGIPTMSGLWVARYEPGSALAYLLVLPGLQAALLAFEGVSTTAVDPRQVPGGDYITVASQGTWVFIYVVITVPLLFFPAGHLASRYERVLLGVILGDAVVFTVIAAAAPGPFLPPDELAPHVFGTLPSPVADILGAGSLALLPLTLIAVVVHLYRRQRASVGATRRQFRWLSLGAGFLPLTLLAGWFCYLVVGNESAVVLIGLTTAYVALPALMSIAVVRPELFDPARLLATATVHMIATAGLLVVFTSVTAIAGLVLARGAPEVALAATAACAVGLARVRSRLQRPVDRWLYPARQVAFATVAELQRDILTGKADPEDLQDRLALALRDDTLVVQYRAPADAGPDGAEPPTRLPGTRSTDILLGPQVVGTLTTGADLSPELLRDIAQRMAPLVELGRVRVDLRRALRDADESRARLLSVSYQERAKFERDLHDGAQQRLVALGMALRLAQRHLSRGVDVSEVLDGAVAEIGTAVSELRQLAHGIRPSCLDDGLELALASLVASTPLPVSVHVQADNLGTDVETTAYYVACEAITNAIKHSGADHIALDVTNNNGQLHVKVADNGGGGAHPAAGSGLAGLRDRVGAHGGQLVIQTRAGQGTVIEAVLPCA